MVEIISLVRGEAQGTHRLSRHRERIETALAVIGVLCLGAFGLGIGVILAGKSGVVLKAPGFLALWAGVTVVALWLAASGARARARRFRVGASIDADAFCEHELELVRRCGAGYRIRLSPGMRGWIYGGRAPAPIEALVGDRPFDLQLGPSSRVDVQIGTTTFAVRVADRPRPRPPLSRRFVVRFMPRFVARLAPHLLAPALAGAVAALVFSGPARAAITEADMRSAIPPRSTPWEAEKILRRQAQLQSHTLHRCFDLMPLSCQRPGFVGVGVALTRDGDIKARWIARSTYGQDCPVNDCMADVVSTWIFDALPEPMKVVLPVQVLRTDRPLIREAFWAGDEAQPSPR